MKWIKKGIILSETIAKENGICNPQVPYGVVINNSLRIFFGARYENDKSASIFSMDVDIDNPSNIKKISTKPLISKGEPGYFDEDGVLPVAIKQIDDKLYMFYGGFSKCISHPHFCMMGLAISNKSGDNFEKYSNGPILPISKVDPLLIGSADIHFHNNLYHMIYTSGTKWIKNESNLELCYNLKYAYSINGIDWNPTGKFCVTNIDSKYAIAKPAIFKIKNEFYMIFSRRSTLNYRDNINDTYRLLTAKSNDLIKWRVTNDIENLELSKTGWDSEMICYPNVINVNNRYIMLYNGNGFGKTGFGYAELKIY